MIPRKEGRILSIASGRGVAGQPRAAHYAASKAGVIAFTKSLAVELAPYNITVNAVCPGATDTPMSRIGFTPEQFKKREDIPPLMDGLTHKFEIVGLLRYLLTDATRFVTGQTYFLHAKVSFPLNGRNLRKSRPNFSLNGAYEGRRGPRIKRPATARSSSQVPNIGMRASAPRCLHSSTKI